MNAQPWVDAVLAALGDEFLHGPDPEGSRGISVHPVDEAEAGWVILAPHGEPVLSVRLAMELDEVRFQADPAVEDAMFEAVRDLEGLELVERGFHEAGQAFISFSEQVNGPIGARAAEVVYERRVDDPAAAADEVRWLFTHLGFAFPFDDDDEA